MKWRPGHFGVLATIAAYTDGEPWLDRLLATLAQRRSLLATLLRDRLPEVAWQPPEATFLAWLDCSALGPDDEAQEQFLARGRVALEPGLRFGAAGSGYARMNFATSAGILDEATARMAVAAAAQDTRAKAVRPDPQ
jgi:cystathionine beta-lyase